MKLELIKSETINSHLIGLNLLNNTKDNYTKQIKVFCEYIKSLGKNGFDYNDIQGYFDYLITLKNKQDKNLSYTYINNLVFALKKRIKEIFKYETDITKKYFLNEKLKEIKTFKVNSKAIGEDKLIKKDEIDLLLSKATKRLRLIIDTLIFTGCRINELTSIRLSDCKEINNHIEVTILGKGGKIRTIKLTKDLFNMIRETFSGYDFLFETKNKTRIDNVNITHQISSLSKKVLNKSFTAHNFRHYFATDRIRKTNNIKGVSKYLGHSTTAITLDMYTHSKLSWEDLLL